MSIEIDLSGRVAFVTGGSRGLGRADALTLARAGADVVIADLLVESELTEETDAYGPLATVARTQGLVGTESAAEEIRAMGRRSFAVRCDVTDRDQVAAAVARTVDELGSVDILVNNAGTLDHVGQFPDQSPELWERDLRVNLTGAFNCAQAVWPHMQERKLGPHREHGLRRRHARWLRPGVLRDDEGGHPRADEDARDGGRPPRDHRATRSCPGSSAPRPSTWRTPTMNERIANRTVFKRPGEPQDIANAIAWLCSDLAVLRDRDRAERLRRRRALRVLGATRLGATMRQWPRSSSAARAAARASARTRFWTRLAILGVRLAPIAVVLGLVFAGSPDRLADGTRIAGIDVGGLTTRDAEPLLAAALGAARRGARHLHVREPALPADPASARRRGRLARGRHERRAAGRRLRDRARLPAARARVLPARTSRRRSAPTTRRSTYEVGLLAAGGRHAAPRGAARPARPAHLDRLRLDWARARPRRPRAS